LGFLFLLLLCFVYISIPQGKDSVGKQLPNLEFSMYADKFASVGTVKAYEGYAKEGELEKAKETAAKSQVFLIPDLSANSVTYLAYYKTEDGIKPIITEDADGNAFIPRFGKKDTEQYRARKAEQAAIEQRLIIDAENDKADAKEKTIKKVEEIKTRNVTGGNLNIKKTGPSGI